METNPSPTPYARLPDHPDTATSPADRRRIFRDLAGIIVSMLLMSSMVVLVLNHEPRSPVHISNQQPEHSPSAQVLPESLMPPSRGVAEGVSEKASRDFSVAGPAYPWTNYILAWQRTAYHFQPEKNWMNDPNGMSSYRFASLIYYSFFNYILA
ncbi:beta-fructofuranosidase [Sarracenia purpurea var. burkii]